MTLNRYASLDVGSNTVRLLIAEGLPGGRFRPLRVERIITRLGGGFSVARELAGTSMEKTAGAIGTLADLARKEGAQKVFPVATGVLREARNRKTFLDLVERHAGISLRILSGIEEAHLMLRGVFWSLPDKKSPRWVIDIGGWSTEVLRVDGGVPRETLSLRLGAVALTERFLKSDPPTPQELEALEKEARDCLRGVRGKWEKAGKLAKREQPGLVGTAGTLTTLAAIDLGLADYDPQRINGHQISRSGLTLIYERLRSLPLGERLKVAGLEKGREDLILAGAAIVLQLMEVFGFRSLEVIDSGLLEGVLLEGLSGELRA